MARGIEVSIEPTIIPRGKWVAELSYPTTSAQRRTRANFVGDTAADAVGALYAYLEGGGEELLRLRQPINLDIAVGTVRVTVERDGAPPA